MNRKESNSDFEPDISNLKFRYKKVTKNRNSVGPLRWQACTIKGKIDGHRIELYGMWEYHFRGEFSQDVIKEGFKGKVNGILIEPDKAKELWIKYLTLHTAMLQEQKIARQLRQGQKTASQTEARRKRREEQLAKVSPAIDQLLGRPKEK